MKLPRATAGNHGQEYCHVPRPGEVYVRRDKSWLMVGRLMTELDKELGIVTPVDEDDDRESTRRRLP